jgi:Tannase and feruloyl esterase
MTRRRPRVTALALFLAWMGLPAVRSGAQSAAPAIQPPAAKLPAPGADKVITEADCTVEKIGTIPTSVIGEPVAAVTVNTMVWAPPAGGSQGASAAGQCVVDGSMAPVDKSPSARPINFRVVLPATWNHRAVHRGGGGMNGVIPQMTDADLGPGYVRYGSDSGHQMSFAGRRGAPGGEPRPAAPAGSENDWATNDEAIRNLAYMQLKKTHDAAFLIVERVYGERPRFSYFVGTSQGGREGLTVVQRYPADYDGVVSIVPIVNFTTLMLAPELIRIHEKPLANWVPPAKAAAIRAEFMRQCDNLDGLVDGVINNYMTCRAIFAMTVGARDRRPWASKRCPNNVDPNPTDTTTAACLTDGQISTLELIYGPYRFPAPLAHGVRQFGMWLPTIEPAGSGLLAGTRFQGQEGAPADAVKHAHLGVLGVTGWIQRDLSANPLDFTEAAYAQRRKQLSEWADATDPELSAFYARGGKLISAIGAQDTLASPGAQLDYYQSVLDKMGRAKVDAFARLYVLPQGNHGMAATTATVDGAGKDIPAVRLPTTWNRFALLVDWVERNTPPGKALTMTGGDQTMLLCSYPSYPKYTAGPALQASSYTCADR